MTVLIAGGYLGGHLSLSRGVGLDQTVFDPGPTDWTPAADGSQLPAGRPVRVVVGDTPVMIVRDGSRIFAIHDRCSHRGSRTEAARTEAARTEAARTEALAPRRLAQRGQIEGERVVRLSRVAFRPAQRRGPGVDRRARRSPPSRSASAVQPSFQVRDRGELVEVRRLQPA